MPNGVLQERHPREMSNIVFPEYSVGFDVREGDILFSQSHKLWHGNTKIIEQGSGKRISVVTYLRQKLHNGLWKSVVLIFLFFNLENLEGGACPLEASELKKILIWFYEIIIYL